MTTLMHADIFFFVTTIVVVVIAIVLVILLIYAIFWIRTLFRISRTIEEETRRVVSDVGDLRADLKKRTTGVRAKLGAFKRFIKKIFQRWLTL